MVFSIALLKLALTYFCSVFVVAPLHFKVAMPTSAYVEQYIGTFRHCPSNESLIKLQEELPHLYDVLTEIFAVTPCLKEDPRGGSYY